MNNKGMTLIELMIVLFIVVLVLAAALASFSRLFQGFKSQTKVAETHISTVMSFELLRKDIEMAGFGIPYNCTDISFNEVSGSGSSYNEAGLIPPFSFGDDAGVGRSDYLVIRSTFKAEDRETTKWAYFEANASSVVSGGGCGGIALEAGSEGMFASGTRVVVEDGEEDLRKIKKSGGEWQFSINDSGRLDKCPDLPTQTKFYVVYGVDSDTDLRAPFNRVDYFLDVPQEGTLPERCAPNTYELYRGQMKQANGVLDKQPVLDCVKNFQVAFYTDSWRKNPPSAAADQKHDIKEIRVFILYQEGQKERDPVSTGTISLGDDETGELATFSPSGDDSYYHWQVKEISVKPMNLGR